MLFTSLPFVILVLITFVIYYLPPLRSWQVLVLTTASFLFYSWEAPLLVILLILSILINVVTSYKIATGRKTSQKFWAIMGVSLNLGLLLFFKYGPLVAKTLFGGDHGSIGHFLLTIPLPIGISFFTFQGISLVVEVFRSKQPNDPFGYPEMVPDSFIEHLKNTMLFKSFFPSLVAGPIIKAHEFYPQIVPKTFAGISWQIAFRALVTGYFLKMVVADNLKDSTFWIEFPYFLKESPLTLATLLFGYSMQIFSDFAGYSLIAIGLAALFGYSLPQNFNYPYISRSFTEFWQRWHISLSTWLREYLYIPLGGNRKGNVRTYINLFVVMFLGGLWHGAAWSYAVWGSFHGLALAAERFGKNFIKLPKHPLVSIVQAVLVFSFVTVAWLLFKLPKFEHVIAYLNAMVHSHAETNFTLIAHVLTYSLPVIFYYGWYLLKRRWDKVRRYEFLIFGFLIAAIILDSGTTGTFIYFQF
ncbi:MAG: MBOAT family O-acyltransferase [Luteolibacter sp.]|uniref:MBOAT family O-acyltransferase n=1 Tax=Luteolibacter sp. TaxID=1962973 RepID=UPI0032653077